VWYSVVTTTASPQRHMGVGRSACRRPTSRLQPPAPIIDGFDSTGGASCSSSIVTAARRRRQWEWDGTTWLQTTPACVLGPRPARDGLRLHPRAHLIFEGGRFRAVLATCGMGWQLLRRSAGREAFARRDHALVYDSVRQRIVLFAQATHSTDTWEWDGTAWLHKAPIPLRTLRHAMAYDSVAGDVLYGVCAVGVLNDNGNGTAPRGCRRHPPWIWNPFLHRWLHSVRDASSLGAVPRFATTHGSGDALRGQKSPHALQPATCTRWSTTLLGGICSSEVWQLWTFATRGNGMAPHGSKAVSPHPSRVLSPEWPTTPSGTPRALRGRRRQQCGDTWEYKDDAARISSMTRTTAPCVRPSVHQRCAFSPWRSRHPLRLQQQVVEFSGRTNASFSHPEQAFSPLIVADTIEVNGVDPASAPIGPTGVPRSCTMSPSNKRRSLPPMT